MNSAVIRTERLFDEIGDLGILRFDDRFRLLEKLEDIDGIQRIQLTPRDLPQLLAVDALVPHFNDSPLFEERLFRGDVLDFQKKNGQKLCRGRKRR